MGIVKDKQERLIYQLKSNTELARRALAIYISNYEQCKVIGLKKDYSFEDLNAFEALTARFARLSDILTQKILKTLPEIMGEEALFFIDRANFAEKLGIVENANELRNIRQLRNTISHEYIFDDINDLFEEVLDQSEALINAINSMLIFISKDKYL